MMELPQAILLSACLLTAGLLGSAYVIAQTWLAIAKLKANQ